MDFDQSPPQSRRVSLPLPLGRPVFTFVLLAANVLVFLAMTAAGGSTDTSVLIQFGAKDNVLVAEGQLWRLFTSMFLHIGVMHLAFNSYALFIEGIEVERLYGRARFLIIYLLAGLWGSLFSFALGKGISAGASGAIFGLFGAMVAYFVRHREIFGTFGRQRLFSLLGVVGINLFLGFSNPGIDNMAHLGGLLSGAALGWGLAPDYVARWDGLAGPRVVDRRSLLERSWVIALAVLLLAVGTYGAMTIQRHSPAAFVRQGQRALQGGDLPTAESFFRQATERDPGSVEAQFYLGVALSQQERLAEAVVAYQAALRLSPDLAEAHWNLALAYAGLDRRADAIAELEAFITLSPDSPDAARARAIIADLRGNAP
jgi:rhomboid protease GluP